MRNCESAARLGPGTKRVAIDDIQQAVDGSFCKGYVLGVVDSLVGVSAVEKQPSICISADAATDQLLRVVAKYLADNPAKLNEPAGALVAGAMADAFPCR
ncbi:MAG: Rap1a/Tai family immunity protein [Candidatus Acidiferrales bacterium]